jgi:hypothetical protein
MAFLIYTSDTWRPSMSEDDIDPDAERVRKILDTVEADIEARDRNDHGYPDLEPEITYTIHGQGGLQFVWPPPGLTEDDRRVINTLIDAIYRKKCQPPPSPKPEPPPETDLQKRERLFRSSIAAYADEANVYACQVCSHRDLSGRPFPSTPEETALLMKEGRRLMDQLVRDTKDLGYSIEEVYYAANHAEKEVAVQLAEENRPYVPDESKAVSVLYQNHRGETGMRRIIPDGIWFGSTEHHPEEGWILDCWDLDKGERRSYSLSGLPGVIFPALPSSSERTTEPESSSSTPSL